MTEMRSPNGLRRNEPYPRMFYEPLRSLWNDDGVQQAFRKGNQAAIPENLAYYYAQLDRLFHPDYQPTQADILRCRSKTTGIIETTFTLKDRTYRSVFSLSLQRAILMIPLVRTTGYSTWADNGQNDASGFTASKTSPPSSSSFH